MVQLQAIRNYLNSEGFYDMASRGAKGLATLLNQNKPKY